MEIVPFMKKRIFQTKVREAFKMLLMRRIVLIDDFKEVDSEFFDYLDNL